ncbi:capping complex subunit for YIEGIA [Ornithinibacillus halotolerans]|uniref:Uncharacterized protein n=1 Tax=Ornithinibacillus halotolerans TaxID=1274357 RepID=A0A916RLZ5_9BACI|nr:hypothetical protein [Ornithinibacillus halotolerans]GGA61211.1 hypothetical protein GCM10008025_01500 [Ornithinibacillus halotolerans]
MVIEKAILAIVTTNKEQVSGGAPIFICETLEEVHKISANLEAMLDGIAHALGEDLFVIVKH